MTVTLDGRFMTTRDNAHEHLAQQLKLPDWYGRNFDALYDLLTAGVGAEKREDYGTARYDEKNDSQVQGHPSHKQNFHQPHLQNQYLRTMNRLDSHQISDNYPHPHNGDCIHLHCDYCYYM